MQSFLCSIAASRAPTQFLLVYSTRESSSRSNKDSSTLSNSFASSSSSSSSFSSSGFPPDLLLRLGGVSNSARSQCCSLSISALSYLRSSPFSFSSLYFSCSLSCSPFPSGGAVGRGCLGLGNELMRRKEQCSCSMAMAAVSGAPDSAPSDMVRRVTVVNTNGEKLAGRLDDAKSKELVVLCHGFRSSKDSNTLSGIAAAILKTGISTFRFDFAGNGESEGQFAYGNYWREAEDLRSVILHWRANGRQVTAILGHSKGGNVVLLYASKYGDVSTVINLSGRFDLTKGMEARFGKKGFEKLREQGFWDVKDKLTGDVEYRVTLKSLEDRLATDMSAATQSIPNTVRVLTIHGEADEVVSVSDAYEFAKRIPNHVLIVIAGGNHNYEESQKELCNIVIEFLQGKLSKI